MCQDGDYENMSIFSTYFEENHTNSFTVAVCTNLIEIATLQNNDMFTVVFLLTELFCFITKTFELLGSLVLFAQFSKTESSLLQTKVGSAFLQSLTLLCEF